MTTAEKVRVAQWCEALDPQQPINWSLLAKRCSLNLGIEVSEYSLKTVAQDADLFVALGQLKTLDNQQIIGMLQDILEGMETVQRLIKE